MMHVVGGVAERVDGHPCDPEPAAPARSGPPEGATAPGLRGRYVLADWSGRQVPTTA